MPIRVKMSAYLYYCHNYLRPWLKWECLFCQECFHSKEKNFRALCSLSIRNTYVFQFLSSCPTCRPPLPPPASPGGRSWCAGCTIRGSTCTMSPSSPPMPPLSSSSWPTTSTSAFSWAGTKTAGEPTEHQKWTKIEHIIQNQKGWFNTHKYYFI